MVLQPPELHPYNFPELLLMPVSPLTEHDHQIRMEALLCRNLDAALTNSRKPYMLEPTAGACGVAAAKPTQPQPLSDAVLLSTGLGFGSSACTAPVALNQHTAVLVWAERTQEDAPQLG